jgi:biopolymer transport protein ExbD
LIDGPKRKNELVALPANVKTTESDRDGNIEKESAMVLTLTADNKLYQRQTREVEKRVERTETVITKEELPAKITTAMEGKTPDNRVVYLKCDVNAPYETVLQVFAAIRKADVDRVGLVVVGEKTVDDKYQIAPVSFLVQLQEPFNMNVIMKPNPLTLVAAIDKDGKVSINNEPKGTIADASRIETTLKNIFKDREDNGIFREGTNEIEKKTYIKVAKSCKYGDFIKLVETVKTAKASPIGIQIDDVN